MKLKDGKRLERETVLPWGPDKPPSDRELSEKFTNLSGSVLNQKMIRVWLHLFEKGIENDERLEETLSLLSSQLCIKKMTGLDKGNNRKVLG